MLGMHPLQEELLSSICKAGPPGKAVRVQCFPRDLENWLGVRTSGALVHAHNVAQHSAVFEVQTTVQHVAPCRGQHLRHVLMSAHVCQSHDVAQWTPFAA